MEKPRTDEAARSAEGREQPVIEPEVTTAPKGVVEASDAPTGKAMHEDKSKLDQSGDSSQEGPAKGEGSGGNDSGGSGSKGGKS